MRTKEDKKGLSEHEKRKREAIVIGLIGIIALIAARAFFIALLFAVFWLLFEWKEGNL